MSLGPLFLAPVPPLSAVASRSRRVCAGDFVIVQAQFQVGLRAPGDWWMGQVVFCEAGDRDSGRSPMCQVANVEDGCLYWVNGDQVSEIIRSLDGLHLSSH